MADETVSRKLPSNAYNLTGLVFGRLTAVAFHGSRNGSAMWFCHCSCGQDATVRTRHLTNGQVKSCGCLRLEASAAKATTHGATKGKHPREYVSWASMRKRCLNPTDKSFPKYGGRGVTICERWQSYEHFRSDMGERPPMTTLDRIDNDGHYEPGNCRWATASEQARNRSKRGGPKNRAHAAHS